LDTYVDNRVNYWYNIKHLKGKKLPHLTLAEGEVTGHAHRITEGQAELYEAK
jgi:hypothetical protein